MSLALASSTLTILYTIAGTALSLIVWTISQTLLKQRQAIEIYINSQKAGYHLGGQQTSLCTLRFFKLFSESLIFKIIAKNTTFKDNYASRQHFYCRPTHC